MQKIRALMSKNNSILCVGLDIPFNKAIIDATHDLVCAYKINPAFYESAGTSGFAELVRTCEYICTEYPEVAIIFDGKRGDVGHSSDEYARAAFDVLGADAVTLNPYLGQDALRPFLQRDDRLCFMLCQTSNPGAMEIQGLMVDGIPLYKRVAEIVAHTWNVHGNCGLVIGSSGGAELGRSCEGIRDIIGQDMMVLLPGIGTQGGDLAGMLGELLNSNGDNVIVNVSRAIIQADDVRKEAAMYKEMINMVRNKLDT
jgi:orotidine-5'-phosphate decarboxylase